MSSRHKFTQEEYTRGYINSAKVRKAFVKIQKQVAKLRLEGVKWASILDFITMFAATPVGSIVIAWFLVDLAQKTGYINEAEAIGLKAIVTSDAIIGALGGSQGILGLAGALVGSGKAASAGLSMAGTSGAVLATP